MGPRYAARHSQPRQIPWLHLGRPLDPCPRDWRQHRPFQRRLRRSAPAPSLRGARPARHDLGVRTRRLRGHAPVARHRGELRGLEAGGRPLRWDGHVRVGRAQLDGGRRARAASRCPGDVGLFRRAGDRARPWKNLLTRGERAGAGSGRHSESRTLATPIRRGG